MRLPVLLFAGMALLPAAVPAAAQSPAFRPGPVFTDFGQTAPVDSDLVIPPDAQLKVAFDAKDAAPAGEVNKTINSAARFINMHVAAGVAPDRIKVTVVVHGPASWDVVRDEAYRAHKEGRSNGSASAVAQLLEKGVDIYLCGQSAASLGIAKDDLLPGVRLALSAMSAHVLLQQQGYAINPF
ncbi:DsrE family protein [Sphingobium lignivorans]|uniref:Intracellular sulfur oxidation DsrE/DsrF family protein n=1 Tax=Sphingobium lignivorans TaxID=2735886 RepID=A0ABR6NMT7_9SPHN|nr:DsrE family protein [Sphingobium lignivorans]MBB5988012.1 intracellular sulfur oxidation DsrE/DsrF family protein [Sphingobium lignivorans]